MLDLHAQIISVATSFNLNHVAVQLAKSSSVPILRHHNNPAKGITLDMLPGQQDDLKNLGQCSSFMHDCFSIQFSYKNVL